MRSGRQKTAAARAALDRLVHVVELRRKDVDSPFVNTYLGVMPYRKFRRNRPQFFEGTLVVYDARYVDCNNQQWLAFYGIKQEGAV